MNKPIKVFQLLSRSFLAIVIALPLLFGSLRTHQNAAANPSLFSSESSLPPGPDIPVSRVTPLNELLRASLDLTADLQAAVLSADRYGGASAAGDLTWASQQMAALLYYKKLAGNQMLLLADKIDAVNTEIHSEGIQDMVISANTIAGVQLALAAGDYTPAEKQFAYSIGMSDADIQAMRQRFITADPQKLAGSYLDHMAQLATDLRTLGNIWINPPNFQIPGILAAQGGAPAILAPNQLGRFYQSTTTFQLGNPLTTTATVSLSLRPVNLPPDWMVTVTSSSALLGPGGQITVTVTIMEGSTIPQGSRPRLAVEGYANGHLIGGVVLDVLVPRQASFDGQVRVYLPVIKR